MSDEYGEGAPHTAGLAQPHPGVAPPPPGEDVVYHRYYQWVVFVLFLQASASKSSIRRFVITEKAPTRAFSWLKVFHVERPWSQRLFSIVS